MLMLAQESFAHWAPIGTLLLMAIVFGVGNVLLSTYVGPGRVGNVKGMVYESGMNPIGTTRSRFNVRFYIVAMTFLVFDVEIVFLYPAAMILASLSPESGLVWQTVARLSFFILTSIIAFAYAWRKGVFRYD